MCGENIRMVRKPFPDFSHPHMPVWENPATSVHHRPGCLWYGRLGAAEHDDGDLAVGTGAVGGEA